MSGLSVPFAARMLIRLPGNPFGENGSPDVYRAQLAGRDKDFHEVFLGACNAVVREIESYVRGWLRGLIHTAMRHPLHSIGRVATHAVRVREGGFCIAHGRRSSEGFSHVQQPTWFNGAYLDFLAKEFERSSSVGSLSYHANIEASWRHMPASRSQCLRCSSAASRHCLGQGKWRQSTSRSTVAALFSLSAVTGSSGSAPRKSTPR